MFRRVLQEHIHWLLSFGCWRDANVGAGQEIGHAPSFVKKVSVPIMGTHPFTVDSVAQFLGAVNKDGQPSTTAKVVMNAFELIECNMLTHDSVINLGVKELEWVIKDAIDKHRKMLEESRIAAEATAIVNKYKLKATIGRLPGG